MLVHILDPKILLELLRRLRALLEIFAIKTSSICCGIIYSVQMNNFMLDFESRRRDVFVNLEHNQKMCHLQDSTVKP